MPGGRGWCWVLYWQGQVRNGEQAQARALPWFGKCFVEHAYPQLLKYHPNLKGLEAAVFVEVSIDPKGPQTQRASKVSSCVQIQIETKGRRHADHAVGFEFTVKVTGRDGNHSRRLTCRQ